MSRCLGEVDSRVAECGCPRLSGRGPWVGRGWMYWGLCQAVGALSGVGCGGTCCRWGCCICLSVGKSFIFIPARCFFDPFCACLCASCSIDCGLFCVVGARRLLRVWVGLGMVVADLNGDCKGVALVMCWNDAWCSVCIGD